MTADAGRRPARDTYRHGDLRRALLAAGIALARAGGPILLAASTSSPLDGVLYSRLATPTAAAASASVGIANRMAEFMVRPTNAAALIVT